jgi:hypothetical protein
LSQTSRATAIPFANLSPEAQQAFALKIFRSASTNVTLSRTSELRIVEALAKRGDSTVKALLRRALNLSEEQLLTFADGPEMHAAQRLAGAIEDLSQLFPSSPQYRNSRLQRQFSLTNGRGRRMLLQLDPFTVVSLLTRQGPIEFFHGERQSWIRAQGKDRELSARLHEFFTRCHPPHRYVQLQQGLSVEDTKRKIMGSEQC